MIRCKYTYQQRIYTRLINPLLLSVIYPWTWKLPLHFLNRSTFHTLAKWKAGFLTVYICYLKFWSFDLIIIIFGSFAIIEVQLALFKISSTSNTRDILHDWCCHGGSSTSKLTFISENPKFCLNILREKLLADVVFVWEI